MKLSEILDIKTGGTIKIRTAATSKAGYSKTLTLVVDAQAAAPTISLDGYVATTKSGKNEKYVIKFSDASKTNPYEYMIVKPGATFDETKTWKAVTSDKSIKLSATASPDGAMIYYRKKGIAANKSKNTPAVLPSAYTSVKVDRSSSTAGSSSSSTETGNTK